MENEAGDSLKAGSTVDRGDRSILALLEIGAAAVLIGSFFVDWLRQLQGATKQGRRPS